MARQVALVTSVVKATQFTGLPEALGGSPQRPPDADILVIEAAPEGVVLNRNSVEGELSGDTWHPTLEEAFEQAQFEFGILPEQWSIIGHDVDPIAWARNQGQKPTLTLE